MEKVIMENYKAIKESYGELCAIMENTNITNLKLSFLKNPKNS